MRPGIQIDYGCCRNSNFWSDLITTAIVAWGLIWPDDGNSPKLCKRVGVKSVDKIMLGRDEHDVV